MNFSQFKNLQEKAHRLQQVRGRRLDLIVTDQVRSAQPTQRKKLSELRRRLELSLKACQPGPELLDYGESILDGLCAVRRELERAPHSLEVAESRYLYGQMAKTLNAWLEDLYTGYLGSSLTAMEQLEADARALDDILLREASVNRN